MARPSLSAACGIVALDDYALDCLTLQLAQRQMLPRAANGRPIVASDKYAAHVIKDMQEGKSAEYRRLLAVGICNLRDGTPLPIVKLPLRRMEAIFDVEAGAYRPRSIVALSRRETREQCQVDLAQLRIGPDNENDLDALTHLEGELGSYLVVADEMMAETQRRIAFLQNLAAGGTPATAHGPTLVRIK